MAGWLDGPMEVIPEEGEGDWTSSSPFDSSKCISRRREIFTSEQMDTLVSTVPKDRVPQDWIIDNEVVDPKMSSTYLTEGLGDGGCARGSTYTYTYESHYDIPPIEDDETIIRIDRRNEEDEGDDERQCTKHTHKVTRLTKVTTTRSVRQIPIDSPYHEVFFDSNGRPIPVASIDNVDDIGIRLSDMDKIAPPPAPPSNHRRSSLSNGGIPDVPGMPEIVESEDAQITLCWSRPNGGSTVLGYQIEMRDYPDGDWEQVHDHILREPSCTITNLDSAGQVQFRVSAAGRSGFSAPSQSSVPVVLGSRSMPSAGSSCLPLSPGKPVVVGVDGSRASIEWTPPPINAHAPPIMGYQLEYRVYGTTDWIVANDTLTPDTRYQVENLRPNGVYEFRVRARNGEGLGTPSRCSGPAHIKPAVPLRSINNRPLGSSTVSPPGQPIVLETDLNWVKLQWGEVDDDVQYLVELREVGDPSWYQANHEPVHVNSILVEGLRPGSTYEFRVVSYKNGLSSIPSEVSDVVSLRPLWKSTSMTSRSLPSRPSPPEFMNIDGDRITLCWTPALSSLPVLGYDIEFRDFQQDSAWYKVNDAAIIACKMTIGDLIIGHQYEFRIIAMNSMGYSEPSDPSNPITIPSNTNGEGKFIEAERFGSIRLLQEEMIRESPPLPDRDDSPPPINRAPNHANLQWRDPNLREVIEYLSSNDKDKQRNASGYLQHLTYSDQSVKDETRELDGILKLLNLLRSDDPVIVKNSCGCLKNLSYGKENDASKMDILSHDGVRLISSILSIGSSDERSKEATALLWNLSSHDPLKKSILEHSTIPLSTIICSPHPLQENGHSDPMKHFHTSLFKNATGVLRNISAADSSARRKLRMIPNLIDTLIHFLTLAIQRNHVDSTSVENVVCILRNLSYRIQEVEDPNYNPTRAHESSRRAKSAPSNSPKVSKKKDKKDKKDSTNGGSIDDVNARGVTLLWQPSTVRIYLKLLQEASNLVTLEACAGAIQNLAACQWNPSVQVRSAVRFEKGLPVLVELVRLKEDHVVCAVATALRNLAVDERNRELIGKYALRDLLDKLPDANSRRPTNGPSDHTIAAVLGILFEIVSQSASSTRDIHESKGTERLRALSKSFPVYSERVCKYASQILYSMWQHKELHDGFKRSGLKESDFYCGTTRKAVGDNNTATLARPISSQGREKPRPTDPLNDTYSSEGQIGYGTLGETSLRNTPLLSSNGGHHNGYNSSRSYDNGRGPRYDEVPSEPLYASVNKSPRGGVDDSWV